MSKKPAGNFTPLPYYGIHSTPSGVQYLFQDMQPFGWEFLGINQKTQLSVKHLRNQCSHNVNVHLGGNAPSRKHWAEFEKLLSDPLVEAMLPIPNGRTYFLDQYSLDDAINWLSCLERLSSPLYSQVKPLWSSSLKAVSAEMKRSNIHPMVLTDVSMDDNNTIKRLNDLSKTTPRTVVFTGDSDLVIPKDIQRLDTTIHQRTSLNDLISLPLEHIGAYIIAKYCRGESLQTAA